MKPVLAGNSFTTAMLLVSLPCFNIVYLELHSLEAGHNLKIFSLTPMTLDMVTSRVSRVHLVISSQTVIILPGYC